MLILSKSELAKSRSLSYNLYCVISKYTRFTVELVHLFTDPHHPATFIYPLIFLYIIHLLTYLFKSIVTKIKNHSYFKIDSYFKINLSI